ncbi:DUF928 domain-containing protein [Desulfobacterales bacterium HSG16]|nr:DUF928 domain-containing protein [Desulfobacterales bacterium HSG16]
MPIYNPPENTTTYKKDITNRATDTGAKSGLSSSLSSSLSSKLNIKKKNSLPSRLMPLAPEHVGLTASSQPVLHWYSSGPWSGKISLTLNEVGSVNPDPILETEIKGPAKEGVYQIRLADYNIHLKPGTDYEYYLTIVRSKKERSADLSVSGAIRYVEPSSELSAQLANTEKGQLHYVYAEYGYWYDAIDSVSRLIYTKPNDTALRTQRGALLAQVKLGYEAAFDSPIYKPLLKDPDMSRKRTNRESSGPP